MPAAPPARQPLQLTIPRLRDQDAISNCGLCHRKFTTFIRPKHNCRHCGHVVCSACSESRRPLAKFGYIDPVRVCDWCEQYVSIQQCQESQLSSVPIKRLKEYCRVYALPTHGHLEKTEFVRTILRVPVNDEREAQFRSLWPAAREQSGQEAAAGLARRRSQGQAQQQTQSERQGRRPQAQQQQQQWTGNRQRSQSQPGARNATESLDSAGNILDDALNILGNLFAEDFGAAPPPVPPVPPASAPRHRAPSAPPGPRSTTTASPLPPRVEAPSIQALVDGNVQLSTLAPKTLKAVLQHNRVDYSGVLEKSELVDRVQRLVDNHIAEHTAAEKPESALCRICFDAQINCVILECGHLAVCMDCGKLLQEYRTAQLKKASRLCLQHHLLYVVIQYTLQTLQVADIHAYWVYVALAGAATAHFTRAAGRWHLEHAPKNQTA
ncbi:hypothetical protein RI367_001037 [Sorochytrium milnesiophthora]